MCVWTLNENYATAEYFVSMTEIIYDYNTSKCLPTTPLWGNMNQGIGGLKDFFFVLTNHRGTLYERNSIISKDLSQQTLDYFLFAS